MTELKKTFIYIITAILCFMCLCTCGMTENNSEEFTNKLGTADTVCAHTGCKELIAPSGETLNCIKHSSTCSVCGCYISEGESMCSQCTIDTLNSLEFTQSQSDVAAFN